MCEEKRSKPSECSRSSSVSSLTWSSSLTLPQSFGHCFYLSLSSHSYLYTHPRIHMCALDILHLVGFDSFFFFFSFFFIIFFFLFFYTHMDSSFFLVCVLVRLLLVLRISATCHLTFFLSPPFPPFFSSHLRACVWLSSLLTINLFFKPKNKLFFFCLAFFFSFLSQPHLIQVFFLFLTRIVI